MEKANAMGLVFGRVEESDGERLEQCHVLESETVVFEVGDIVLGRAVALRLRLRLDGSP